MDFCLFIEAIKREFQLSPMGITAMRELLLFLMLKDKKFEGEIFMELESNEYFIGFEYKNLDVMLMEYCKIVRYLRKAKNTIKRNTFLKKLTMSLLFIVVQRD